MKKLVIAVMGFCPLFVCAQKYQKHSVHKDKLSIHLSEGLLNIIPLTDKAIRIQWEKALPKEEKEFVLINKQPIPSFTVSENNQQLKLNTAAINVTFNKQTGAIDYADK